MGRSDAREKKLPLALIGAFFIIGALLGLLFVESELYHDLRDRVGVRSAAVPSAKVEERAGRSGGRQEQIAPAAQSATAPVIAPPGEQDPELLVCNPEAAQKIIAKAREIAEIDTADGVVNVRLRRQWAYYTPGIRRSFLEAFAESDACLEGGSRPIHFYYDGVKIAVSTPPQGLREQP